jgi:hypothetical protein
MKTIKHICTNCNFKADNDSDYCPRCGILFIENTKCENHHEVNAEGVCVICVRPFCSECCRSVSNVFLCSEHDNYEIYEGMAKVFGTSDEVQVQYIKKFLEENDLHPFIYSKKSTPMQLGGNDQSLIDLSGKSEEKVLNEIKLLVPCGEFLEAEKLVSQLNI